MLTARGPRVVLLHGLAGSPANWAPLVEMLDVEVRVPSLPWGATGPEDWAYGPRSPTSALLDSFRHDDLVVAHSYAANLLLHHLSTGSGPRPSAVVLISPFYSSRPSDFRWDVMHHYLVDFDQILQEGLRIATTRPIDPDLLAEMARRVRDRIGPYGWIRFFESYLATPSAQLAAIDIPVHLVHGALDTAAPPDGSRALLDGLSPWCPAALTELEASAHFPMLDEPEKVWSVIEKTRFSSYLQRPRSRKATA